MPEHLTESQLRQWIDGELSPSESAVVEKHLETCDRCASSPALGEANRWLDQHRTSDLWPSLFRQEANDLIGDVSTDGANGN